MLIFGHPITNHLHFPGHIIQDIASSLNKLVHAASCSHSFLNDIFSMWGGVFEQFCALHNKWIGTFNNKDSGFVKMGWAFLGFENGLIKSRFLKQTVSGFWDRGICFHIIGWGTRTRSLPSSFLSTMRPETQVPRWDLRGYQCSPQWNYL
mgnify:CR=1 FL=1